MMKVIKYRFEHADDGMCYGYYVAEGASEKYMEYLSVNPELLNSPEFDTFINDLARCRYPTDTLPPADAQTD